MGTYKVKYYAGTYSGTRTVTAEDAEDAIAKVRAKIRGDMTLSMYSDSYKVVEVNDDDDDDE